MLHINVKIDAYNIRIDNNFYLSVLKVEKNCYEKSKRINNGQFYHALSTCIEYNSMHV